MWRSQENLWSNWATEKKDHEHLTSRNEGEDFDLAFHQGHDKSRTCIGMDIEDKLTKVRLNVDAEPHIKVDTNYAKPARRSLVCMFALYKTIR